MLKAFLERLYFKFCRQKKQIEGRISKAIVSPSINATCQRGKSMGPSALHGLDLETLLAKSLTRQYTCMPG